MRAASDILLLDGAMGSELDRRRCDTSLPLWSARALIESPQIIAQIHRAYLEAGADLITTNTFRTHRRTLAKAGLGDRAEELTRRAVALAIEARDQVNPEARVLGSVAPLEDCYQPDLAPPRDVCVKEHREMTSWLVDAGVDFILIETMNNVAETLAAIECAKELAPGRWMVSCCLLPDADELRLLSGEPIDDIIDAANEDAFAIGINCIPAPAVEPLVRELRARIDNHMQLIAYANVGRADAEKGWINTDAVDPKRYAHYASDWIHAGATIVGGCCGTTPRTIGAVRAALISNSPD